MATHSIGTVITQSFPFSYTIMCHIRTQCHANVHAKLIESCKEFFVKNPILVVEDAQYFFGFVITHLKGKEGCIRFKKLNYKLWLTSFMNFTHFPTDIPLYLSFFRLENAKLRIDFRSFPNIKLLISNLEIMAKKKGCIGLNIDGYNIVDS